MPNLCELLLYTIKLALFSVSLKPFALFSFLAKGKASGWDVFTPVTSFGNSNTTKKAFGNLPMEIQVTGNQWQVRNVNICNLDVMSIHSQG